MAPLSGGFLLPRSREADAANPCLAKPPKWQPAPGRGSPWALLWPRPIRSLHCFCVLKHTFKISSTIPPFLLGCHERGSALQRCTRTPCLGGHVLPAGHASQQSRSLPNTCRSFGRTGVTRPGAGPKALERPQWPSPCHQKSRSAPRARVCCVRVASPLPGGCSELCLVSSSPPGPCPAAPLHPPLQRLFL